VLSFDWDFGEPAAMVGGRSASVIMFRPRDARARHVIERLSSPLEPSVEPLGKGAVVVIENSRIRIPELPIGRKE